jgi:cation diffusion facilitator CzcD-associated flavoprotein CzcO
VRVLEAADDVGGTWYWNRYPGARCDIPTTDYTYSFDPDLDRVDVVEKYATQPEILRYAQFVADRYDLRRDIDFNTKVSKQAAWDDAANRWQIRTSRGETHQQPLLHHGHGLPVGAQGARHRRRRPLPGPHLYHRPLAPRGRRLHRQRVAVIGTGSSGSSRSR